MGLAAFNRMRRLKVSNATKTENKEDVSKLKVDEIKSRLAELGIEIPGSAKKDELIKLLQDALASR